MFRPLTVFIGLRNFTSGAGNRMVSFISLLAILGLVMGVALLVVVMSVMNGFDREMESRILAAVPHIRLLDEHGVQQSDTLRDTLVQQPNVRAVMPFTRLEGMLTHRGKTRPVEVMGLEPSLADPFMGVFISPDLMGQLAVHSDGLLMAGEIAKKLSLSAGDRVTLLVPASGGNGLQQAPKVSTFTVLGTFDTRTAADQSLVLAKLETASRLAGHPGLAQGWQVRVADVFEARQTGYTLLQVLPSGYRFSDWIQTHGNLYQAIKMSRNLVSLLVFLIIAIAVFNVISMLMMTVIDKRAEIAILKTQGFVRHEIVAIFLTQGVLIGLFGTLLGVLLGVVGALNVTAAARWLELLMGRPLLNSEIYPLDYLPSALLWNDVGMIVAVALALNFLATLYPAIRAANTRPADVLRYE